MNLYDHIDANLKAWARWVYAQRDKAAGWPGHSPITKFGQPSGKGYGTDTRTWEACDADMIRFDATIRTLKGISVRLLMVYYVQCHARVTMAARLLHTHPTQLRRDLIRVRGELRHAVELDAEKDRGIAKRKSV